MRKCVILEPIRRPRAFQSVPSIPLCGPLTLGSKKGAGYPWVCRALALRVVCQHVRLMLAMQIVARWSV